MNGHRVDRWGPYMAAFAVSLSFIILVLAAIYTVRQADKVDRKLCAQTVDNRRAVRSTWVAARKLVVHGITDPERKARTNLFFEEVLRPIPPLRCVDNKPVVKED